jgi:ATP-dependent Clp protease adaptor protein ClpS
MSKEDEQGEIATSTKKKPKTIHPKMFRVILLNDDYTSMDFVVSVLETIFQKSPAEAVQIMLNVHHKGRGICGTYTKQIAETKILQVHDRAQSEGFPLRCIMEEV